MVDLAQMLEDEARLLESETTISTLEEWLYSSQYECCGAPHALNYPRGVACPHCDAPQ